jgi:hypothetical protein
MGSARIAQMSDLGSHPFMRCAARAWLHRLEWCANSRAAPRHTVRNAHDAVGADDPSTVELLHAINDALQK